MNRFTFYKTPLIARNIIGVMAVFMLFFLLLVSCLPTKKATDHLVIFTQDGKEVRYQIELALTNAQQANGLMHIDTMPADHGMLFIDDRANYKSMWMKNTLIPLDMLFIDSFGQVIHIHRNAIPYDLTTITSPVPSIAVLEINAGQVDKHGFEEGDIIKDFKIFMDLKKALE